MYTMYTQNVRNMYDQWCHMLPCQNKIENANTKLEDLSLENYFESLKNFQKFSKNFKNNQKTKWLISELIPQKYEKSQFSKIFY